MVWPTRADCHGVVWTARVGLIALGVLLTMGPVANAQGGAPEPSGSARARLAGMHGRAVQVLDDSAFSDLEMRFIRKLETEIMCACIKENWSRTLSNCPDGCADPQKQEIREMVRSDATEAAIYQFMINKYGPKVRSTPPGILKYLLPSLIFVVGFAIAWAAAASWRTRDRTEPPPKQRSAVDATERAEIERELEELS